MVHLRIDFSGSKSYRTHAVVSRNASDATCGFPAVTALFGIVRRRMHDLVSLETPQVDDLGIGAVPMIEIGCHIVLDIEPSLDTVRYGIGRNSNILGTADELDNNVQQNFKQRLFDDLGHLNILIDGC